MRVRWLLMGVFLLLAISAGRARPEELPDNERTQLNAKAQELTKEFDRLYNQGKSAEALDRARQSLAIYRQLYPKNQFPQGHLDLATSIHKMGNVLQNLRRLEEALDHYQEALAMFRMHYPEKQFPDGHAALARIVNDTGLVLQRLGRQEEALKHYQQALAMLRKLYPEEQFPQGHAQLLVNLMNMGSLLQRLGRFEGALEHRQEALAMCRKLYPENRFPRGHKYLAMSLNNLGSTLKALGRLEPALEYYKQALAMDQKLYPEEEFPQGNADQAACLNNIGSVHQALGSLETALEYFKRALAMYQKCYPENQFPQGETDLATSLNNIGNVLQELGRWEAALEYTQRALTMREKLFPEKRFPRGHADLARSLNNMGALLQTQGRLKGALDHYQRALAMRQKLYPTNQFPQGHQDLASSLNNMGSVLHSLNHSEGALEYYQQALAMYQQLYPENRFPQGHPDLANSLINMGSVLENQGHLEKALEYKQQALVMWQKQYPEKQFPEGHTELANALHLVGGLLLATQHHEEAMATLGKAVAMQRTIADRVALVSSESEALAFAHSAWKSLDFYLSATRYLPQATPATYTHIWKDRAPLNRILLQRHKAAVAAASDDPEIRKLFDRLQTTRRDLARLLLDPLPTVPQALLARDRRVNDLTDAKQQLERNLVKLLPDIDRQRQLDTLGPDDLRKALPMDAVFVDVLRYLRREFDPKKPGRAGESAIPHYCAFVVRSNAEVRRVELGEAKPIDQALADFLHLIEQRREHDNPQAAATLRRLVWDPLAGHFPQEAHTVYLAPDGDLTHLPWAALPGSKKDSILLEDHALALVPHGPFLLEKLRSERRFGQGKGTPLVLGGVRYSEAPTLAPDVLAQRGPGRDGSKENWPYLAGTERELILVKKLAGQDTLALQGKEASVPRLLSALPQARLAHLATHGFFNQKEYRLEIERAEKQTTELLRTPEVMSNQQGHRITAGAKSPLAYTGLVLAGANVPDKAGPSGGILTGESIVDLDLRKMELAVLSACQTGLGEAENGECVHNLQIAFHVAGCANVAASLWNVPDESTAALMGLFYRELLDGGKPPLEAMRSAQLYLYHHPGEIKGLSERGPPLVAKGGKLPEPEVNPGSQPPGEAKRAAVKDWAAFVLSGVGR